MNRNYIDDNEITINKSITINGNGHSIESTSQSINVNINGDINLTLKNITFKNKININNTNSTIKLKFIDCTFNESPLKNQIDIDYNTFREKFKAGEVSQIVKFLAKEIVGKSNGIEAAQKLASWVGKNIKHETAAGFYQSPDETLNRSRGNCCSQTLLFLQMCEAVGINKDHKLYFVHVGTFKFKHRHFFAMIDNKFIDVDSKPDNPWGNAKTLNDTIFSITEYPYLPLFRKY